MNEETGQAGADKNKQGETETQAGVGKAQVKALKLDPLKGLKGQHRTRLKKLLLLARPRVPAPASPASASPCHLLTPCLLEWLVGSIFLTCVDFSLNKIVRFDIIHHKFFFIINNITCYLKKKAKSLIRKTTGVRRNIFIIVNTFISIIIILIILIIIITIIKQTQGEDRSHP